MSQRANILPLILLLVIALAAAAPLWGPGIVNTRGGGDSPFLLQRVHQMALNLQAGVFPVRWMPDAAYGLGYPFFSYYAALPYYLASLLVVVGLDILTAIKATQTLGFLAAALAMYGWMCRLTNRPWAAWLGAVAYTVAPFHLVNVYVRGDSLSEFYAFIFYPLILWALDLPENYPFRPVGTALAYAGLLLTHNISAFIFTPFALLYGLMRRPGSKMLRDLGALGLGLLLSAWFWVPALAESPLAQLGTVTQGYFHYTNHFRAQNLVQNRFFFDYSLSSPDRTPFAMGLPQAIGAALGGLVLWVRLTSGRHGPRARPMRATVGRGQPQGLPLRATIYLLVGLVISTLMITPLSRPLWDCLPLLPMVQFPWRFLSVQALFAAAVLGMALRTQNAKALSALPCFLGGLILVAAVLVPLRPDRLSIGPEDVTRERLLLYELFTGNIGTTIRHEYLYREVVPRPFTSDAVVEPEAPPRAIPLDGARLEATRVASAPTRQVWRVAGEGGGIAFPLLYWPGWRASVDDQPVEVGPVAGSGYLSLRVPPGEHTVVLWLGRTPVRAIAEGLSLVTALGMAVIGGRRYSAPLRSALRTVASPTPILLWGLCALCGFCFLRLLPVAPHPAPDAHRTLTMDFIQMPYLHPNPQGVRLEGKEGQAELLWYILPKDRPSPGDLLTVTLKIEAPFPYTATLALVSPASVRYDLAPLAEVNCAAYLCPLAVPPDIPRGIYLLRLRVFGPQGELTARTPSGAERGAIYLAPVRVIAGPPLLPETPVLHPFGPEIRLYGATVVQTASDRLSVSLVWGARYPVATNYGISLRLRDRAGQDRVVMDTQPGYGFLPTSLWRPGERVTDRYELPLPADLPQGEAYTLLVVLYRFPSLQAVGERSLGPFPLPLTAPYQETAAPRRFALPPLSHPMDVTFGEEIRLAGYDLAREGERLHLTLYWQALTAPRGDYTRFIHLFDPTTGVPVAQNDSPPRGGKYPTSWWVAGEVVTETVALSLKGVPPGRYRLAVGLYDATVTRLPATGSDGHRIPDDRPVLPAEVTVEP
ncbi:MAG: 6-pyruvoyl-tetrahydropterin synthase-related protein [Anaerolineae bacterium]|nr:6-pyruvoyl-tetrahydropterin synthase-related protein [Anaerolineae bacterium]